MSMYVCAVIIVAIVIVIVSVIAIGLLIPCPLFQWSMISCIAAHSILDMLTQIHVLHNQLQKETLPLPNYILGLTGAAALKLQLAIHMH